MKVSCIDTRSKGNFVSKKSVAKKNNGNSSSCNFAGNKGLKTGLIAGGSVLAAVMIFFGVNSAKSKKAALLSDDTLKIVNNKVISLDRPSNKAFFMRRQNDLKSV